MQVWNLLLLFVISISAAIPVENFYPFGPSTTDRQLIKGDDVFTTVNLFGSFPFYGLNYTTLYLHSNGIISFEESFTMSYTPRSFPIGKNMHLVAPYWADVDTTRSGSIWYRNTSDSEVLERADSDIRNTSTNQFSFQPQFAFIATWDKVGYYYESNKNETNTFQSVLVTDGSLSFAIFLYANGGIQWTTGDKSGKNGVGGIPAQVGVNAGDGKRSMSVPESGTPAIINISMTSNVAEPGVWIFQVHDSQSEPSTPITAITATSSPLIAILLNRLNDSFNNLNSENYEAAMSRLAEIVKQSENSTAEQNESNLATVADYLTQLAKFTAASSNVVINDTVAYDVVQVVSSLLQWNPDGITGKTIKTSSRLVQSFEAVMSLFAQRLTSNGPSMFQLPSLYVTAELENITSLTMGGKNFTAGDKEPVRPVTTQQQQSRPLSDATISLPGSMFEPLDNHTTVGVFFALYRRSVLFPSSEDNGNDFDEPTKREVGSYIIAATVGLGLRFLDLKENVTIILRTITEKPWTPGSEECVSWDFSLQGWTTVGCTTHVSQTEDGLVTCSCNHLTNFAILVDVCSREENCPQLNEDVASFLTFVSYIGMVISIISLIGTIITLLAFKKLRQKDVSKYHIQLALAMLLMLAVSIALVTMSVKNTTDPYEGCVLVSVFVHYFTLVAVMWMGAEALLMFQKLVIVFSRITTKFMVSVSIACWTVPLVLVLIPLIVDLANGSDPVNDVIVHRSNSTQGITFCFLYHPGAFWGTFLAPVLAVLIFNFIIFIWVIVVLIQHSRHIGVRNKKRVRNKIIIHMMISISGVMFLFGLTWLFAILTFSVNGLRETFQILFTVFNSFQGFFIFLFFCVFNHEALECWKKLFLSIRRQPKLSLPSQTTLNSRAARQTLTRTTKVIISDNKKHTLEKPSPNNESENNAPNNNIMDSENNLPKEDQESKDTASDNHAEGKLVAILEKKTDSVNNPSLEEGKPNAGTQKKERETEKSVILKARFKRYTTKRLFKHHVEEAEIEIHSYSSSHEATFRDE